MTNIEPIATLRTVYGSVTIGDFLTESGKCLKNAIATYERTGNLDGPVILVCHALTGNRKTVGQKNDPGWWSGLIGPNKSIDTLKYQVITFDVLGGCYGSTGPTSIDDSTGKPYRMTFPVITIRDMVRFQKQALEKLGIHQIKAVIGGSLGGLQALEWGCMYPEMVEDVIALAATPFLSDYAIGFNRIGIEAIINDPAWNHGNYENRINITGLKIARMVGMITYRSDELFNERFNRSLRNHTTHHPPFFEVESYLTYQGQKLISRFDPNSYLYLLYAMNTHDIGRGRGGWKKALKTFQPKLFMIGFQGDLLYKPEFIKECIQYVPNGTFTKVETKFGHDGFLTEFDRWGYIVTKFLEAGS